MSLGQKIKFIRTCRGESTIEFGKLFDPPISSGQVSRWENDLHVPKGKRLGFIAELANISVEDLLQETCTWTPQVDGCVCEYDTDRGEKYWSDYSPYKFKFCPYCGKEIIYKGERPW